MHRRIILLALLLALAACGGDAATTAPGPVAGVAALADPTAVPKPTATTGPTSTPKPFYVQVVQDLATIEGRAGDESTLRTINDLLDRLAESFPETKNEIGDRTAQSHAIIKQNGRTTTIVEILTEMDKLDPVPGLTYTDAVIGWMIAQGIKPNP